MTVERVNDLIQSLNARHALLWREVTMSDQWRELSAIEAQLRVLQSLVNPESEEVPQDGEPSR